MNVITEALRTRSIGLGNNNRVKEEGLSEEDMKHVDDFHVINDPREIITTVEGLGKIALTPEGGLRVNSEQLLKISRMGVGTYRTESLENGDFLIIPQKNDSSS